MKTPPLYVLMAAAMWVVGLAGEPSLEYIWAMDTEAIKAELSRFKGVGPKTISCVLVFTLQRDEFPVDTVR